MTLTQRLNPTTVTLWTATYISGETERWVENHHTVYTKGAYRYVPAATVLYDEHDLTVITLDGRTIRIPGHAIRRVETIEVA